jgi:aminotransferase
MLNKLRLEARAAEPSGFRSAMALAVSRQCANLGPGLCNMKPHPRVIESVYRAIASRANWYTECEGVVQLRTAIAKRYLAYNHVSITPANVLATCGATGAFESICKCFLDPGDEVVMFEPFYQYHVRQVRERGAIIRFVRLRPPRWAFLANELETAITNKTKLLVMANPHNPTGKVFSRVELEMIGEVCHEGGVVVVCDEVYEYMVGLGQAHVSMASLPGMFDHTLTLSSAGKTLQVTGWRVGWLVGPESVIGALRVKADETYLCAPAPLQYAVAECLSFGDGFFSDIQSLFERKRLRIASALQAAGFSVPASDGAFYVLAGYEKLGYRNDLEAMTGVIEDFEIASIPGSVFCSRDADMKMLRFCFAVEDDVLERACECLEYLGARNTPRFVS